MPAENTGYLHTFLASALYKITDNISAASSNQPHAVSSVNNNMDPTPLGYFCNWTFAHILLCPLHLTQPRYLGAMGQRSVGAGQVPFWVDHMAEWLGWDTRAPGWPGHESQLGQTCVQLPFPRAPCGQHWVSWVKLNYPRGLT